MDAPDTRSLTLGDVFRYRPLEQHCHEGLAVVVGGYHGPQLFDTYWAHADDLTAVGPISFLNSARQLREEERATLEFQFNLNDYRPAAPGESVDTFEPTDVVRVTAQHGLTVHHFVKHGAVRSNQQILLNHRRAVEEAQEKLESAKSGLDSALAELERAEQRDAAGERL